MSDFAKRLRAALGSETVYALAKRLGLKPSSINNWLKDSRPSMPAADMAIKLARAVGVSIEWLITGEGEMRPSLSKTTIRNFDVEVSAGDGRMALHEKEAAPLAIDAEWLWKTHMRHPADVFTVRVVGDSMSPDLPNGSLILVDSTKARHRPHNGIWVFRECDQIKVKRLQFITKNKIQAESLNNTYKPYTIDLSKLGTNDFALIGMVLGTLIAVKN